MAMELVIYGARQFGIKEYPSRASWGSLLLKIETRSYLKTIWESMVLWEYRMGDCHEEVVRPTYKVSHFDRQMLFSLFF